LAQKLQLPLQILRRSTFQLCEEEHISTLISRAFPLSEEKEPFQKFSVAQRAKEGVWK